MGKLVVFLKDASPVEVPLDKERVTIGRRPDNDVCLPYPAVSGEHAAVVTILADSFLEDIGSTNGTLVNGKPVAKHFLRDRDQIDVGRQLLVYLADASAPSEVADPRTRDDWREGGRAPEPPARVEPRIATPIGAALDGPSADLEAELDRAGALRDAGRPPDPSLAPARLRAGATGQPYAPPERPVVAPLLEAVAPVERRPGAAVAFATQDDPVPPDGSPTAPNAHVVAPGVAPASAATPVPSHRGRVEVLSGPQAGRVVDVTADTFVIGRVGAQVVALVSDGEGVLLVPREGPAPAIEGAGPMGATGGALAPGDAFDVAGVRMLWHAPDLTPGVT